MQHCHSMQILSGVAQKSVVSLGWIDGCSENRTTAMALSFFCWIGIVWSIWYSGGREEWVDRCQPTSLIEGLIYGVRKTRARACKRCQEIVVEKERERGKISQIQYDAAISSAFSLSHSRTDKDEWSSLWIQRNGWKNVGNSVIWIILSSSTTLFESVIFFLDENTTSVLHFILLKWHRRQ